MNNFNIFMNVYVHYPEAYNEAIVGDKINQYFKQKFLKCDVYVKFYSAPSTEEQILVIEATLDKGTNIDQHKEEWNKFLTDYFKRQIEKIIYKIKYE